MMEKLTMNNKIKLNEDKKKPNRSHGEFQEYVDPKKTIDIEREKKEDRQHKQPEERENPKQ